MQASTFSNLHHIGLVVRNMDKTIKRLEALGVGPFMPSQAPPGAEGLFYRGKPLNSNFVEFSAGLGNIELEIFEPDNKPSPWKEFLDAKGEGIHHLAFKVENLQKEIDRLAAQGAEVILTSRISGKLGGAYLDLKASGIIVELMNF